MVCVDLICVAAIQTDLHSNTFKKKCVWDSSVHNGEVNDLTCSFPL